MGRRGTCATEASPIVLQDIIDASDTIGRWEWDIPNDRLYADATVALLFSIDPMVARAGVPLSLFLESIHREDRAKTAEVISASVQAGRSYVQEYRVYSADGVMRWVMARGLIELNEGGQPHRGTGFLIDITQSRANEAAYAARVPTHSEHPLEQAAEHCLAARQAVRKLPEPLLHNMTDMLLLELGKRLVTHEQNSRLTWLN